MPVGPANIELLRRGLHEGFKPAFEVGIGAALSDSFLCILAYFGIVKFLLLSKLINVLLGLLCSAVMIMLGVSGFNALFNKKTDVMKRLKYSGSHKNPILMGFLINTSNPMVIGFWVVFLGAVSSYSGIKEFFVLYPQAGIFLFAFTVFIGSLLWFYFLSHIVIKGKKYLTGFVFEIISFVCSTVFILFGLALIYGVLKTIFM
ncbi:MAG TPA: LysE family transporter [Candidatus Wallbacteria bacterium]|nr:LysE family transporter [Candidatus Wallbacteria bacterium]